MRAYRKNNPAFRVKEQVYRDSKAESHKLYMKDYNKEYYAEHRVEENNRTRLNCKKYYWANRERMREDRRLYWHNYGPQNYRKNLVANRKSKRELQQYRIAGAGYLTKELIQQVYEGNIKRFGTLTCYLCLKPIKFGDDNLEHKVPIVRGGKHELSNLDVAHKHCNQKKGTMTYSEYLKSKI